MGMNSNETTAIPNAIAMYQAAHDRRDVDTAIAQFTADASVLDDGKTTLFPYTTLFRSRKSVV